MIYGYARVSTIGQARDGNSLEAQMKQLRSAGAEEIFSDRFTGTTMKRPEFMKLCERLHEGDTLVVTKLDRLGRSVSQASGVISDLMEKGVTINVLNLGVLSSDSVNTLLRNVLLAFAQFERDMIVERTQEGKAIARQDPDFQEGRPKKYSSRDLDAAMLMLENHTYRETEQLTGISKSTLWREAKLRAMSE